ncbi:hypothetical protein NPS70_17680 [Streptomyces sp. C10-9-1]|nr:hypothetical protein [Streptomyces sp. C10-9-1]
MLAQVVEPVAQGESAGLGRVGDEFLQVHQVSVGEERQARGGAVVDRLGQKAVADGRHVAVTEWSEGDAVDEPVVPQGGERAGCVGVPGTFGEGEDGTAGGVLQQVPHHGEGGVVQSLCLVHAQQQRSPIVLPGQDRGRLGWPFRHVQAGGAHGDGQCVQGLRGGGVVRGHGQGAHAAG